MKVRFIIYFLILFIVVFSSCKKEPDAPTGGNKIEIGETIAERVAYHTAKVNTNILGLGKNEIIQFGHCWSTSAEPTIENDEVISGVLVGNTVRSELTGLAANTIYYICSFVTYKYGTLYGDEQNLKTLATGKPIVTTLGVSDITINTAQCGCDNDDGGLTISQRGVCWNTTGNPTLQNNMGFTNEGNGTGSFNSKITSLNENTTYYVAAYATNEKGTGYGEVISFMTLELTLSTVETANITNITANSATGGGNVTSDGNGTVTARGVCWNTTGNPTLENNMGFTNDGSGTGSFTSKLTGLTDNTTYYVAAYATNEEGTDYGQERSFFATNDFTDPRDGQTYKTEVIGSQRWFAQNLNYETTNSWCYDNNGSNCNEYGRLYEWEAATAACPLGWHLPSDEEWKTLEIHLGMSQDEADNLIWRGTDEGKKLKSTTGWNSDGNGTDEVGFSALPGGIGSSGDFHNMGYFGNWWSATATGPNHAWHRKLYHDSNEVYRNSDGKKVGFSVRCVKD